MFALAFMFLGLFLGYITRTTRFPGMIGKIVMPLIYALLFCMGVLIGNNEAIMANLPTLGLSGLVLAAATLVGSMLCVALVERLFPAPHVSTVPGMQLPGDHAPQKTAADGNGNGTCGEDSGARS